MQSWSGDMIVEESKLTKFVVCNPGRGMQSARVSVAGTIKR